MRAPLCALARVCGTHRCSKRTGVPTTKNRTFLGPAGVHAMAVSGHAGSWAWSCTSWVARCRSSTARPARRCRRRPTPASRCWSTTCWTPHARAWTTPTTPSPRGRTRRWARRWTARLPRTWPARRALRSSLRRRARAARLRAPRQRAGRSRPRRWGAAARRRRRAQSVALAEAQVRRRPGARSLPRLDRRPSATGWIRDSRLQLGGVAPLRTPLPSLAPLWRGQAQKLRAPARRHRALSRPWRSKSARRQTASSLPPRRTS